MLPIQKWTPDQRVRQVAQFPEGRDVLGFLCIDSPSRGVFSERYDVALGAAIADALYIVFDKIRETERQKSGGACEGPDA